MRYNPALDGIRAIAIALVLACHTDLLPNGWIGVDVFFVLSGYLITTILLSEYRATGGVNLGAFYWRRAVRLIPALAILVAFQLIRSAWSADGSSIRMATLIGALYVENWNAVFGWHPEQLMDHTWSLATEEQFYLIWPLLLPLAVQRGASKWLIAVACAMVGLSVALWWVGAPLPAIRVDLFTRPVGLVIGCLVAFRAWRLPRAYAWPAVASLVAIACVSDHVWVLAPLLASIASAVLIAAVWNGGGLLAWTPVRYIGRISYGIYLYHWPIFMLGEKWKPHGSGHLWALGLLALIVGCAAVSYELVEKPALRLKGWMGRIPVEPFKAAMASAMRRADVHP